MNTQITDMSEFSAKKGEIGKVAVPFLLADFVSASADSDEEAARIYADRAWDLYEEAGDLENVDIERLDELLVQGLLSEIRAYELEADQAGEFDFEDMHSFHPQGGDNAYTMYVRQNTMDVLDEINSELNDQDINPQENLDSMLEKHAGTNKAQAADAAYELRNAIEHQRDKTRQMLHYLEGIHQRRAELAHN